MFDYKADFLFLLLNKAFEHFLLLLEGIVLLTSAGKVTKYFQQIPKLETGEEWFVRW